ncbi:MAG TPA: hypothetical protein VJ461_02825 [Candidatus Nanoarchaeia archaeon]|nr:hypothetical protein [Candidatus Nanoarchaeia archaeon]
MSLFSKKTEDLQNDSELFGSSSTNIKDELELIQDQQENIIRVSEQLEKALGETDKIRQLHKIIKKIDDAILKENIQEKRKQESRLINIMEEIKRLLKAEKYEDIEKLMLEVQSQSKLKIRLSQEELHNLRAMMNEIEELYKEAAGLCRLYKLAYDYLKQIHDKCQEELGKEMIEEEELSKAGAYTQRIP